MEAFNILREACWNKPTINFNELPLGEYPVHEFMLVQTRFGQTLKVDLGAKWIYLPTRFGVNMNDARVLELNSLPKIMVYTGRDPSRNNL